jgi:hypothetical protein
MRGACESSTRRQAGSQEANDGVKSALAEWMGRLEAAARDAQAEGAIDPAEDAQQLAFELDSYLLLARPVRRQPRIDADRSRAARRRATAGRGGGRNDRIILAPEISAAR